MPELLSQLYNLYNEKKQDKMYKISKRTATVTIDSAISNFLGKIRQGPDYVCTCCHRMIYKQNVISYNIHKYTKCSTDVLENVFAEESNYTCSNGKQWVCKTCDGALTRGNIPVQAKANGFKLPSIPPEFSSLNSLEVRLISLRVPFMKMVALPSGKQRCIHGPAVNVPSKLDSVCELLPRLPSESELVPFKLKRKLSYKGHYIYDYVHPDKVMSALRWLKANNPLYKDVTINEDWVDDSLTTGSELFTGLTEPTKESMDTDNTCTEESMGTENIEESNTCTEETMETSCTQPQSANDVLSSIASRNGFIIHAVPDDGNCLFSAIAYQLASIGIPDIDANTLRAMVVSHLEDHPHINGVHYRSFLSALVAANDPRNADTEAPTAVDDYISTIDDPDTRAQLRWLRYYIMMHGATTLQYKEFVKC